MATLGGVTVASPITPTVEPNEFIGTLERMASGALHEQVIVNKENFEVEWGMLSETEKNTLVTRLKTAGSQAWVPDNSTSSYTIIVDKSTIRVTRNRNYASSSNDDFKWDVQATFREV
jgi:hypothetical protein